jgi:lipopolysaccharide transport system permease protein
MFDHLKAVWNYRHFWMSLVRMDLRQRYRRSALGIGWSLLHPLAMTAVFCVVFSSILGNSDWKTYAPFLLAGLSVWEFIRNSATAGCSTFIRNEAYIRQCPLPCGIYPLRTVMGAAIHFLISLSVVIALVTVLKGNTASLRVLWSVLPAIVLTIIFAWSLATLAAFATIYFHDTQHLVDVGAQFWFFITPIIYSRDLLDRKGLSWVADLNPVNLFLELIRTPLLSGEPPALTLYLQAMVLTGVMLGLAIGTIAWLQRKLIFQL